MSFFITLEGPEGAGKSSQLPRLQRWLEARGHETVATRNPGGTAIGRLIRQIVLNPENQSLAPMTELMLYAADRAQHVIEVVKPALARGAIVLCDRYTDSTIAYQGYGRGLDQDWITCLNQLATGGLAPDLTLLLDLDVDVGLARITAARAVDRLEQAGSEFHHRLRAGYLAIAAQEPGRVVVVDAGRAPDEVFQAVCAATAVLLGAVADSPESS